MSFDLPLSNPPRLVNVLRELVESKEPTTRRLALTSELFSRAQTAGNFTSGGATAETGVGELAEMLRPFSAAIAAGMSFVQLDGRGNVYPGIESGAEVGWVSETGEVPTSSVVFNGLTLSPKRCGTSIRVSTQLMAQSPKLASFTFQRDLRSAFGYALDLAAFSGIGGVEPVGVSFFEGIDEPCTFGGPANLDDICLLEEAVADNRGERPGDGMAFVTSPAARRQMRQIDSTGIGSCPIWNNNRLIDRPAFATPVLSATDQLLYGYWPDWLVVTFGVVELISDPYTLAKSGQVEITANLFADCGPFRKKSFARSTDSAAQE